MKDYIYIGTIAFMFVFFLILHIRENTKVKRLMKRYEKFMRGKSAENLADALEENFQQMERLEISHQKNELKMDNALNNITSTLCMLDDNNTGFILNTMHGRDSSYSYIKEIIKGEAYATLGEEEKEALDKALNS